MSGRWMTLFRCAVCAGALLVLPLPAAFALAPEESDATDVESMADGMQILDLRGVGDGWGAPDLQWPFGIPRSSEESGAGHNDHPVRLADG